MLSSHMERCNRHTAKVNRERHSFAVLLFNGSGVQLNAVHGCC